MKRSWSINKQAAPKDWEKFKRWYKAACNLPDVTAEQAYRSLGYTVPKKKDENIGAKEKVESVRGESE